MDLYQQQMIVQDSLRNSLKGIQGTQHPILDLVVTVLSIQGSAELMKLVKDIPFVIRDQLKRLISLVKYIWFIIKHKVKKPTYLQEAKIKTYTPEKNKNSAYQAVHYYLSRHVVCDQGLTEDVTQEYFYNFNDKLDSVTTARNIRLMKRSPNNLSSSFTFNGSKIEVTFSTEQMTIMNVNEEEKNVSCNVIVLKTFTDKKQSTIFDEFLKECTQLYGAYLQNKGRVRSVYYNSGTKWVPSGECKHRSFDSVILPKDFKDYLLSCLKYFKEHREDYLLWGQVYKFNLLLFGLAGTGKTSLTEAISLPRSKF